MGSPSQLGFQFKYMSAYTPWIFDQLSKGIVSTTSEYNNEDALKVFSGHYPAGSSMYNWVEIYKLIKTNKVFDKDYGKEMNLQKYGQESPPEVHLKDVL